MNTVSKTSTIIDIARRLQLSPSTVSRALNNHPKISDTTRRKVMKLAADMDYIRSLNGNSPKGKRTRTIGLIVPRITMFFHASVITVIQNMLHQQGYKLIIAQTNDSVDMEKELTEFLYSSHVDGVIAATTLHTTDFSHYDLLIKKNIPLIFYDRVPQHYYPAQIIKGDDYTGAYLATEHLIECGCKSIAHITGPLTCSLYQDRYAGYVEALKRHNIPFQPEYVFFHELTAANARATATKLLNLAQPPEGVFAANDVSAIEVVQLAREMKINIPGNLKAVGYSNDPRGAICSPSITTVNQFPELVAQKITKSMLQLLAAEKEQVQYVAEPLIIPVELIVRSSTAG